jgi:hypothetical protein
MTDEIVSSERSQKAAESALSEIRDRSFSGRHPELGRMINCQFCGLRHRAHERLCEQKFAQKDGVVYGELTPPEGLTNLTIKQVVGVKMFAKRRINPHRRLDRSDEPHYWARVRAEAIEAKKSLDKTDILV